MSESIFLAPDKLPSEAFGPKRRIPRALEELRRLPIGTSFICKPKDRPNLYLQSKKIGIVIETSSVEGVLYVRISPPKDIK